METARRKLIDLLGDPDDPDSCYAHCGDYACPGDERHNFHCNEVRDALRPFAAALHAAGPKAPETGEARCSVCGDELVNPACGKHLPQLLGARKPHIRPWTDEDDDGRGGRPEGPP